MERKTPLELLEPSNRELPLLAQHWGALTATLLAIVGVVGANLAAKRPVVSGLHRYAVIVPTFGFAGKYVQDYRDKKLAMKDAIMRDYISRNPEHFELPPRQKIGEIFGKWTPMR